MDEALQPLILKIENPEVELSDPFKDFQVKNE